jgi:uncharacterized repeat protein (TIGR01451 family)
VLGVFMALLGVAPVAQAHHLEAVMDYMFFDQATQDTLDARIAGGWVPGTPLLQVNDQLGFVIKAIPATINNAAGAPHDPGGNPVTPAGTTTGVGGYIDFYVPNGVTVVDVGYLVPNGSGGFNKVDMKGQSLIAIGDGPIGAKVSPGNLFLNGLTLGPNVNGVSSPTVNASGLDLGTIAGVYGDTGIFYSTSPKTAWNSYETLNSFATPPSLSTPKLTDNFGASFVPLNEWDAEQLAAFGIKGSATTRFPTTPIVDTADSRGNAPWGMASGVAGPQSGYQWSFNMTTCGAPSNPCSTSALMKSAIETGPWKRLQYPGSRVSLDQPGLISTVLGYANKDASTLGIAASTLPATTSQSDGTSPNVIRWAVGQLTLNRPEYVWVKIKVNNTSSILDASGCPHFQSGVFGGDAGGTDGGKDHLWRYYWPSSFDWNGCVAVGKPSSSELGGTGNRTYTIKTYNLGTQTLHNVTITDTLPSGISYVSATVAPSSTSPLTWTVGNWAPGQKFETKLTVNVTGSGVLSNCLVISGLDPANNTVTQNSCNSVVTGTPYVVQSKTASTSTITPGGTVDYTITLQNIGGGAAPGSITVNELLPTGFSYVSLGTVKANGAVVTGTTVTSTNPNTPSFVVPASINAGQSMTITFTAKASTSLAAGTYCNSFNSFIGGVPLTTGSQACVTIPATNSGQIGDTLFVDWNGNGTQDTGEPGLAGVTVTLSGAASATAVTDSNGKYLFNGLPAGSYTVTVPTAGNGGVPAGYTISSIPPGTAGTSASANVTLAAAQQVLTEDWGYKPTGSGVIGDQVFDDKNLNGTFDSGDVGISGVTVKLYQDANGNGTIDATDPLVGTQTTDASGVYSFTGLATGVKYIAYVDQAQTALATTYFGGGTFTASTADPHNVGTLAGTDNTADFGFHKTAAVGTAALGDQVFVDSNKDGVYQSGEPVLSGVEVDLYLDSNNNGLPDSNELVATTATNASGVYGFTGLAAGKYIAVVDPAQTSIPAAYSPEGAVQIVKTLAAGQTDLTADFPFVQVITKTVSPTGAQANGTAFTYTLKPTYAGAALLTNARLFDPLPLGVSSATGITAGGTSGAYTPQAAVNGSVVVGGTTLADSFTTSTSTTTKGSTITVSMKVTSSATTIANVAPNALNVSGGNATCTPATQTAQSIPSGATGVTFTWSCTLLDVAEYIFSADADDGGSTNVWDTAYSASVLATTPGAGTTVVNWSLGSNTADVPGTTITGGTVSSVYAFTGNNTTGYYNYLPNATTGTWSTKAVALGAVKSGAGLTTGVSAGTTYIYALEGNNKNVFWRYDLTANSWATRATLPAATQNTGGNLTTVGNNIFALKGNGATVLYSYTIDASGSATANTWATVASAVPFATKLGSALASDGTSVYILQGNSAAGFAKYTPNFGTNPNGSAGTMTSLTAAPFTVGDGGSLARMGDSIYAFGGAATKNFAVYSISGNSWTKLTTSDAPPATLSTGSALVSDGTRYLYALDGTGAGKSKVFWRYDTQAASGSRWSVMSPITAATGLGANLVYVQGVGGTVSLTSQLKTDRTLVSSGDSFHVTETLTSATAVGTVSPGTLTITGATNSASASCGAASPASQAITAGGTVTFTWTCTAAPGTNPGTLAFTATAAGTSPTTTWPQATSNSVIEAPTLSFTTNAVTFPSSCVLDNTGILSEQSGNFGTSPSNQVENTGTTCGASIGDYVWADVNGDGLQTGETGIAGVTVKLYSGSVATGTPLATTTTDVNGAYHFNGLAAGTYTVATDPASYPANNILTTPATVTATLAANATNNNFDFGLQGPTVGQFSSIGDYVWLDANADGVQDATETGLAGITVKLYRDLSGTGTVGVLDATDPVVATATTDSSGKYLFSNLPAGNYLVQVDEANSTVTGPYTGATTYALGAAMAKTTGTVNAKPVTLPANTNYLTADFGYDWSASIGDTVYYDTNNNGVQNAGETGVPNSTLSLFLDSNGNGVIDADEQAILAATTCDGSAGCGGSSQLGVYSFTHLPPGNYIVHAESDGVVSPTQPGVYGTMVASSAWGEDYAVTPLGAGVQVTTADFGFAQAAKVSGNVFFDANSDGALGTGDAGLGNGSSLVLVTLSGTDANGNPVSKTTYTSTGGGYAFLVPAGTYSITYNTSQTSGLGYPIATTPTSLGVALSPGQEVGNENFGVSYNGSIGDRVWNDANGDGIQSAGETGIAGVTLNLYLDADGNTSTTGDQTLLRTTATDATGAYHFYGLPNTTGSQKYVVKASAPSGYNEKGEGDPGALCSGLAGGCDNQIATTLTGGAAITSVDFGYQSIATTYAVSGTVWNDNGAGGGGAGNGTQGGTEPGLTPVTVNLYQADGTTLVASTATSASGAYSFPGVPNGTYVIKVDTATLGLSSPFTQSGDPDGTKDSQTTVIVNNANVTNQNFGYWQQPGSIAGKVCYAKDGNGQCGSGETGINNVLVTLKGAGVDGIFGTADDTTQTTNTNSSGVYSFASLTPGLYQVLDTNPSGVSSLDDADGGNPDNISVSLGLGQNVTTRDFEKVVATLSGTVFYDTNQNGLQFATTEPGTNANGSLYVTAVNGSNAAVATAQVAADGTFSMNVPGNATYTLVLSTTSNGTTASLPGGLFNTGENNNGTVVAPADGKLSVAVAAADITGQNFGIVGTGPAADNDSASTRQGVPVTLPILANDTLGAGASNFVNTTIDLNPSTPGVDATFTVPNEGTFTRNANGTVTFTPVSTFTGVVTIPYVVYDNLGQVTNIANITVTVTGPGNSGSGGTTVNQPLANPDARTTPLNTPVTLDALVNDVASPSRTLDPSTVDLDPSTAGVQTTKTVAGQGTFTVDGVTHLVTFTPVTGFTGVVSIPYAVTESGASPQTANSTITITVTGGSTPTAQNDSGATPQVTPITLAVLDNDTASANQTLTPTSVILEPAGAQTPVGSTLTKPEGTWVAHADGTVTFTPTANYNGTGQPFTGTTSLPYSVKDSSNQTVQAAITIVVNPTSSPSAVNDTATTPLNTPVTLTPAGNDTASAGAVLDPTTIVLDPSGTPKRVGQTATTSEGTWLVNADGTVTFTPNNNYTGTTAALPYQISDSLGHTAQATLTVTVTPPGSVTLSGTVFNDLNSNGAQNGIEPGTSAGTTYVTAVLHGTSTVAATAPVNADGTYQLSVTSNTTYDLVLSTSLNGTAASLPAGWTNTGENSNGTVDGTADGKLLSVAVVVSPVTGQNFGILAPAPVANPDAATTLWNTSATLPVTSNDVLAANSKATSFDPASIALNGQAPGASVTVPQGIWTVDTSAGTVTFTPNANFSGTVTLPYTVKDNLGEQTNSATITVVVGPNAVNDSYTTPFNTPVSGNAATADTYPAGSVFSQTSSPAHGTVSGFNPSTGAYTYTPALGFTGVDSFTYQVCFSYATPFPGGNLCSSATETITVAAGVTLSGTVFHDFNRDAVQQPAGTPPEAGTNAGGLYVSAVVGGSVIGTAPVSAADGTWSLPVTPNTTYDLVLSTNPAGSATASLPLGWVNTGENNNGTVVPPADGKLASVAVATSNVTGQNFGIDGAPPAAANDSASTRQNVPVTLPVLANDSPAGTAGSTSLVPSSVDLDPSAPGIQSSKTVAGEGTFSRNADGTVTFTPVATFTGVSTIPYTVNDNLGQTTNIANITVTVTGPGNSGSGGTTTDQPLANPDVGTTPVNTPITVTPKLNDVPSAGNALNSGAVLLLDPTNTGGVWTANPDGTVTFTPNATGVVVMHYRVTDSAGKTADSTITITVTGGATPSAQNDSGATPPVTPITLPVLANDAASAGQTLTPTSVDLDTATPGVQGSRTTSEGSWVANPDGTVTFTPTANYNNTGLPFTGTTAALPYAVTDSSSQTATATITVIVNPTAAPNAANDSATTPFNTPVSLAPAGNDTASAGAVLDPTTILLDPAGTPKGVGQTATTAEGQWLVNADGTVTFTPNAGFTGTTAALPYQISDSLGHTAQATLTVVVGPHAVNDNYTTAYQTPVNGNVATADTYPAGAVFTSTSAPSNGTLSAPVNAATGAYTYTPAAGFSGTDSFTYTVCLPAPNGTLCSTATDTLVVGPHAADDSATTPANTPVSGSVTGNDAYAPGSTFSKASDPAHGTVTVNPDGSYTYTPALNYSGPDSFTYTVCLPSPNQGLCSTATVNITIAAPPTVAAVDDSYTTAYQTPVSGLASTGDTYPNGSTFSQTSNPANGVVSGFNATTGAYTYTPNAGFSGTDSFTYKVCLPAPNTTVCANATETIVVGPHAVNDTASTPFNTPLNGNASGNDIYAPGSVFTKTTDPSHGTVTVNANGSYTYTPANGYSGTDSFTYTVCLPSPNTGLCSTATVNITVAPAGQPPEANNDSATTPFNTPVDLSALANDAGGKNAGGTPTTLDPALLDLDPSAPGVQTTKTVAGEGTFTVNPTTGVVTFTPVTGFTGTASIPYTVGDNASPTPQTSNTALITVVVNPPAEVNTPTPPVANNDFATTALNTPVTLTALSNDFGGKQADGTPTTLPAAAATVQLGAQPPASTGVFSVNPDGTVTFTPNPTFVGTATIPYTVTDSASQLSNTATITVVVSGGNTPSAVDDHAQTPVNTPVTTSILGNDTPSAGFSFNPATLDLGAGAGQPYTVAGQGTFTPTADGKVTFQPVTGFTGTVSIPYTVTDTDGKTTGATLTILVTPVTVTAVADSAVTPFNTPVMLAPYSNDSAHAPAVLDPSTVDLDPSTAGIQTTKTTADGTWTVTDVFGNVQFTPNTGFTGVTILPLYAISDSLGNVATATVTVVVGPNAVNDSYFTPFNTPVNGDVSTADTYPAGAVFANTSTPANGALSGFNSATGAYTYTPATGFSGVDSFTYTVCLPAPNGTVCATATDTVVVGPHAADDSATTPANTPVIGSVTGNDHYAPGSVFSKTGDPAHGTVTVNPDGSYTYTPALNYSGPDSFTYQVCLPAPNADKCSSATVNITVVAPPLLAAVDDGYSTAYQTPVNGLASTGDTYPGGSVFSKATDPAHGTVSGFNPTTGAYTYTPANGFSGTDSFTYQVCLPAPNATVCATATDTIVVGPHAVDDSYTTPYLTPVNGDVKTGDAYPAGSTFAKTGNALHGVVSGFTSTPTTGSTFTYTPAAGFSGIDSFTYEVCLPSPNGALCSSATETVLVAPSAVNDSATTPFNTPVTSAVAGNDVLPSNPTFTKLSDPAHGTVSFNPTTGAYTYTPANGYSGTDSFTYKVCLPAPNGSVCSNVATVTITVGQPPQLAIVKTASTAQPSVGLPFSYTLTVSNTGGATTAPVVVGDTLPAGMKVIAVGAANWSCVPDASSVTAQNPLQGGTANNALSCAHTGPIASNGSDSITLTVVPTAISGNIVNQATVTGDGDTPNTSTCNGSASANCGQATVTPANPRLQLGKAVTPPSANPVTAGSVLTYSFKLVNGGDVALTPVTLTDLQLNAGSAISCARTKPTAAALPSVTPVAGTYTLLQSAGVNLVMQPFDEVVCTGSHTVTSDEVAAGTGGHVENTATAVGNSPDGAHWPSTANGTWDNVPPRANATGQPTGQLSLVKTAALNDTNGNNAFDMPETVTYTFVVRNIGTTTIGTIAVNDPLLPGAVSCPSISLAAGASMVCTAPPYALTQADVTAGKVVNTATATGVDPNGSPVKGTDTKVLESGQPAAIDLKKTAVLTTDADSSGTLTVGDTLTYTLVATNTGSVALTKVNVSDTKVGSALACSPSLGSTLSPGAAMVCTATYKVQNGEANPLDNTGSAYGTPVGRQAPVDASANHKVLYTPAAPPVLYTVGSLVWMDPNNNGIVDSGEQGVSGVIVRLLLCDAAGANCATALQADGLTPVADATTVNGNYQFTNVPANTAAQTYKVQVRSINFVSDSSGTRPLYAANSSAPATWENDFTAGSDNRDHGVAVTPTGVNPYVDNATTGILSNPFSLIGWTNTVPFSMLDFGFVAKPVATAPDLVIVKTAGAASVTKGNRLTYTLAASNAPGAGSLLSRPVISDTLPAGMTAVLPITATGWSCSSSTSTRVLCSYTGALPVPGGSNIGSPIVFQANVGTSTATGSVTNTANITQISGEPSYTNNTSSVTVTVNP